MGRTRWIELTLLGASLLALAVLVLGDAGGRGVEVEVRDPPRNVDAVVVHVSGAVEAPGVVTVEPGGRVADAVALAGGYAEGADTAALNLARRVSDEERIVVPHLTQAQVPPIDLNRASIEELTLLPGIGTAYARRIVEARGAQPFASSDDLLLRELVPLPVYEAIRDLVATP